MGISSSSEVIWLAARGSHHGHLQEQFQRRGMQPQQPQQAVSPVAESRAPGGPLTQEFKGGAFAATSCCLRGQSGTGPPAAAAASPKGAGRGEGCGEGQVQGMAVSRLFTRSTSTSFVMLDALDAGGWGLAHSNACKAGAGGQAAGCRNGWGGALFASLVEKAETPFALAICTACAAQVW